VRHQIQGEYTTALTNTWASEFFKIAIWNVTILTYTRGWPASNLNLIFENTGNPKQNW